VGEISRRVGNGATGYRQCERRQHEGQGQGQWTRRLQAKRDILKTQLELREIDVDMLPSGMEGVM